MLVRILVGARSEWRGCEPDTARRIYFANHGSHFDTIAVMAALPWPVRRLTHPVAARDYWGKSKLRRFIAETVLRAVLIDRKPQARQRAAGAARAAARTRQVDPDLSRGHARRRRRDRDVSQRHLPAGAAAFPMSSWCRSISTISSASCPRAACCRCRSPARRGSARRSHVEPGEDKAAFLRAGARCRAGARRRRWPHERNLVHGARRHRRAADGRLADRLSCWSAAPAEPESVATVRNLNARIRSWWVMVVVFGGAIALGPTDDHRAVRHAVVHGAARVLDADAVAARRSPRAVPVVLRRAAAALRAARRSTGTACSSSSSRSTPS